MRCSTSGIHAVVLRSLQRLCGALGNGTKRRTAGLLQCSTTAHPWADRYGNR